MMMKLCIQMEQEMRFQVYKLFSSQAMILGYISRIQLIIHTMRPQQILLISLLEVVRL